MSSLIPVLARPTRRLALQGLAVSPLVLSAAAAQPEPRTPFEFASGKMFVTAVVNGRSAAAIVDSGASHTVLDRAFAQRLGLQPQGRIVVNGIQGRRSGGWATGLNLQVGEATLDALRAAVLDLSSFAQVFQRPVDVVLGRDLFDRYVVDIDFQAASLAFAQRQGFEPVAGAREVALSAARGLMTTAISVEGGPMLSAVVDLGSDAPLILSPRPGRPLLRGRPSSTIAMGGFGETSIGRTATARSVRAAGGEFRDVPVQVAPRSIGFDANLGLPILSRFRLQLDFGGRRMWARQTILEGPFVRDRTGLYGHADRGRLKIIHVARGGPAAAAGWRGNEEIVEINGMPALVANGLMSGAPGQVVEFTLADGSRRSLTLRDYF